MKRRFFILFLSVFLSGLAERSAAQTINTVAGTGAAAFGGDGALATAANVNMPYGVATDTHGNVYIADYNNNRIRKINIATGIIKTVAGTGVAGGLGDGGLATAAQIQLPRTLMVDDTGSIYFSDYGNNRVRKIDTFGYIHAFAGVGSIPGFSGDGGPATAAQLGEVWGIARDDAGNFYLADQLNNRVRKVDPSGIITTFAGNGVAFFGGDGGPATAAKIQYPTGVATDHMGNLYVADNGNNRIRKINSAGIINTIAGSAAYGFAGDGGPSTASKLYYPRSVCTDISGNVYITDIQNFRIRKINTLGIISTIIGNGTEGFSGDGGPATAAEIDQSSGVAVDLSGNIYISDNNNNRIREVSIITHAPLFIGGHAQEVTICPDVEIINIDTLLDVNDIDVGQTETWSLVQPPISGLALTAYSTLSTGSAMMPSTLTYTPALSFTGLDSFKVRVTDGIYSDTTTIFVNILPHPSAGVITGADSVCPGGVTTLTDTVAGGSWSITNASVAISATGVVTAGTTAGTDTVVYTFTNQCGTATTIFPITVKSICINEVGNVNGNENGISIYPEPNHGSFSLSVAAATTEPALLTVTNMMGQKVKEMTVTTNKETAMALDVPAGVYYVSVYLHGQKMTTKMIVIK